MYKEIMSTDGTKFIYIYFFSPVSSLEALGNVLSSDVLLVFYLFSNTESLRFVRYVKSALIRYQYRTQYTESHAASWVTHEYYFVSYKRLNKIL